MESWFEAWLIFSRMHNFKIVLVAPDIPGNTGSIGRTCVALNIPLILVKPYGFDIDEKSVRRAGLDYWKYLNLVEYDSFDDFLKSETPEQKSMFFFSRWSENYYYDCDFNQNPAYLIFGSETKGLPKEIMKTYKDQLYKIPIFNENVRSLNLANAANVIAYEALRQCLRPKC